METAATPEVNEIAVRAQELAAIYRAYAPALPRPYDAAYGLPSRITATICARHPEVLATVW